MWMEGEDRFPPLPPFPPPTHHKNLPHTLLCLYFLIYATCNLGVCGIKENGETKRERTTALGHQALSKPHDLQPISPVLLLCFGDLLE